MKEIRSVAFAFLLVVGTISFHSLPTVGYETQDSGFFLKLNVTFSNKGTKTWNLTQEDRSWLLFMNNSWQIVRLIEHAHPWEMTTVDVDGNSLAVFQFQSELAPGENITDYVTYYIRSRPRSIPNLSDEQSGTLDEIPDELQETYCGDYGFWMIDNPEIRNVVYEIVGNETRVLVIVKKLVTWMWTNIGYKSHDPPFYPNETLFYREGDCDEQAILFGTFCRIFGIPTYIQHGCIYMKNYHYEGTSAEGHITFVANQVGWHGWAIVYIPPWGWLPVDLTFVLGSRTDPLNAIKTGAVTLQNTIQTRNVSKRDYLASNRLYKDFLKDNDFYLYMTDEMWQGNVLLGDVNYDGIVNILDAGILAMAFGSKPGDENWNVIADLNRDEEIDILDAAIIAEDFGKTL